MAREHRPDVVLLDIRMPVYDGFMIGKIFKRNLKTKEIPIIYLSGKKTRQDISSAIQAGGADYIVKPFSPSDLLTHLRRIVTSKETLQTKKNAINVNVKEETQEKQNEDIIVSNKPKIIENSKKNITRYGDVMVCSDLSSSFVLQNCSIYRVMLANIVADCVFKVVVDTKNIDIIDGAGLALLVSVNESLKSYGGELKITFPSLKVNNQVSYVKMVELFRGYDTVESAVESFQEGYHSSEINDDKSALNICVSCTYMNVADARFCAFCGTNLIMGRGVGILEVIRSVISHQIVNEALTIDTKTIKMNSDGLAKEYDIPSEFNVELYENNITLKYKSVQTVVKDFKKNKQIGIKYPVLYGKNIRLHPGMKLQLSGTQSGAILTYETEIISVDEGGGVIYVNYSDDAIVLLSQKFFSVAPSLPITVSLLNPSFGNSGSITKGKILELSRVRMVVFSEDYLPENECLAVNFILPDGQAITSPLVIAIKRRERFMYAIEFVMIDEKERSKIIHYMYKRQIEIANK